MRRIFIGLALAAAMLVGSTSASAQEAPAVAPPAPPAAPAPNVPAQGQWVFTDAYGWVWVPAASTPVIVQEQPYVYLYTPSFGWTWYGSPWGRGTYYVGPWVHHAWGAPRVWYRGGWVAPYGGARPRYVAPRYYHPPHYGPAPHYAPRGGGYHGGHR